MPIDLAHDDPVIGRCIVTFDGRVLELFNERSAEAKRMIVGLLHVGVDEPNRKGRRQVTFTCAPNRRGGGFTIWAEPEQWVAVEPFVAVVTAAVESHAA